MSKPACGIKSTLCQLKTCLLINPCFFCPVIGELWKIFPWIDLSPIAWARQFWSKRSVEITLFLQLIKTRSYSAFSHHMLWCSIFGDPVYKCIRENKWQREPSQKWLYHISDTEAVRTDLRYDVFSLIKALNLWTLPSAAKMDMKCLWTCTYHVGRKTPENDEWSFHKMIDQASQCRVQDSNSVYKYGFLTLPVIWRGDKAAHSLQQGFLFESVP